VTGLPENAVIVPLFCERCRYHLLVQELHVGEDGPWVATDLVARLLLFQQMTADPDVQRLSGGNTDPRKLTDVLASYGCPGCAFPDLYRRVVRILQKGLDYAAAVSQGKAVDPDHPDLSAKQRQPEATP